MVGANTPGPARPTAPNLSTDDLWRQFWADAYRKEVQTAATYSIRGSRISLVTSALGSLLISSPLS